MDIYDDTNVWERINVPRRGEPCELVRCEQDREMNTPAFFARSLDGGYLFLVRFPETQEPKKIRITELQSCHWAVSKMEKDAFFYTLILTNKDSWWIFKMLCLAIYEEFRESSTSDNDTFVYHLNKVLLRYAAFFKTAGGAFTAEQALGLYGELLFLRDALIPRFGAPKALRFWRGPEAAPKDYSLPDAEFEIKTTLDSEDSRIVKISNLKQLEDSPGKNLYLVLYTLQQTDDGCGTTLKSLVESIQMQCLESADVFLSLLQRCKYNANSVHAESPYEVVAVSYFAVNADFPRMTLSTVPREVTSAKYSLDLTGLPTVPCPFET